MFGIVAVDCNVLLTLKILSSTRRHAYMLHKPQCTRDIRSNFFCNKVINKWNSLHAYANFASLTSLKKSSKCVDLSAILVYVA